MRPERCLIVRRATPEKIDLLVEAGELLPAEGEHAKRFLAFLTDRAAGMGLDEAYTKHYPEDRPSDDVGKVGDPRTEGETS